MTGLSITSLFLIINADLLRLLNLFWSSGKLMIVNFSRLLLTETYLWESFTYLVTIHQFIDIDGSLYYLQNNEILRLVPSKVKVIKPKSRRGKRLKDFLRVLDASALSEDFLIFIFIIII